MFASINKFRSMLDITFNSNLYNNNNNNNNNNNKNNNDITTPIIPLWLIVSNQKVIIRKRILRVGCVLTERKQLLI